MTELPPETNHPFNPAETSELARKYMNEGPIQNVRARMELEDENRLLRETLRLQEESQIPMIPCGAQQKMELLEEEVGRLREALVAARRGEPGWSFIVDRALAATEPSRTGAER